jgi:hypothetical protein
MDTLGGSTTNKAPTMETVDGNAAKRWDEKEDKKFQVGRERVRG